jgi:predicted CXXCH cytochrome family protein
MRSLTISSGWLRPPNSAPIRPVILLAAALLGAAAHGAPGIRQGKHNLSASGGGTLTANAAAGSGGSEICIFCHTPHTAGNRALWNRYDSAVTYTPYKSSSMKASVGQPTGVSKLCLSCHDGTVALGKIRSRSTPIQMRSALAMIPKGPNNLGTDLTDDHPISFKYDARLAAANGQLASPPGSSRIHLDGNGELQCTSCHDPHSDQYGKFLVMNNTASALCVSCHKIKNWNQSSHSLSGKIWNGNTPNPWPHTPEQSVAANGCENCHDPHGAGGKQRLLNYAEEEQNCYACHNGNVAAKNVQAEFSKVSVHPVINTLGVHDPMELTLVPSGASRHVECDDCHNPHATAPAGSKTRGGMIGALTGVRGVNSGGASISQVTYEYELCFRCHADTAKGPARVNRQFPQLNTRLEFQNGGATNSFHPVVLAGRSSSVPSLKPPLTVASMIGCGDCHNSDSSANNGGSGPNGPHGSVYAPLLERSLSLADTGSNPGNSALCFKCHDFVNTAWPGHVAHMEMTSCMTCHDPHGSPNARLINFNPSIVVGSRSYRAIGNNHGSCTLSCHGKDHNSTY